MNSSHAARVLAHLAHCEDSRWLGVHGRAEPDHAGYIAFEVFRSSTSHFYWIGLNEDTGELVGACNGPFASAKLAFDDAGD